MQIDDKKQLILAWPPNEKQDEYSLVHVAEIRPGNAEFVLTALI